MVEKGHNEPNTFINIGYFVIGKLEDVVKIGALYLLSLNQST